TGIVFLSVFSGPWLIDRQQAAAFKVNEVCRHHDKFAGKFDVELLEGLKIFEVLASNALDRNVVDVDLVLFDQVKQEVERSFEDLELNLVIGFHALPASFRSPVGEAVTSPPKQQACLSGNVPVNPHAVHEAESKHDHEHKRAAIADQWQGY